MEWVQVLVEVIEIINNCLVEIVFLIIDLSVGGIIGLWLFMLVYLLFYVVVEVVCDIIMVIVQNDYGV